MDQIPGEGHECIPKAVIGAEWNVAVFEVEAEHELSLGDAVCRVHEAEISVERGQPDGHGSVGLRIQGRTEFSELSVSIAEGMLKISEGSGKKASIRLDAESNWISLRDYFELFPPTLYLADLSSLEGTEYFKAETRDAIVDDYRLKVVDWAATGTDITNEADSSRFDASIHKMVELRLAGESADGIVFYDHGTREIADFVQIVRTRSDEIQISFLHCKSSSAKEAGARWSLKNPGIH